MGYGRTAARAAWLVTTFCRRHSVQQPKPLRNSLVVASAAVMIAGRHRSRIPSSRAMQSEQVEPSFAVRNWFTASGAVMVFPRSKRCPVSFLILGRPAESIQPWHLFLATATLFSRGVRCRTRLDTT